MYYNRRFTYIFFVETNHNPNPVNNPLSNKISLPTAYPTEVFKNTSIPKHKKGGSIQTIGTNLSRGVSLVNSPKKNNPSKGPYVYEAIL